MKLLKKIGEKKQYQKQQSEQIIPNSENYQQQYQQEQHNQQQYQEGQNIQEQYQQEQNNNFDNQEDINQLNINNQDAHQFQQKQNRKGVCYLSRIPPYMKPNYIRKLLDSYSIQRIYLLQQSQWTRKNRIKRGGNKRICFRQGWVQFTDKRMAKLAALTLNGQKMVPKKGNFYSQDLWNLKYLPKFKWHHLTERLSHEQRLKKQRLRIELQQQNKNEQFYENNLMKSKKITGIIKRKQKLHKQIENKKGNRTFQQIKIAQQIKDE